MKTKNIRALRADEIELRVQIIKQGGCSLLLYKTARVDNDGIGKGRICRCGPPGMFQFAEHDFAVNRVSRATEAFEIDVSSIHCKALRFCL